MFYFSDDSSSNAAVRNLVMDHTNSSIFERNHLSRMIRYDVQAAYLGNAPEIELIRAANRMSRWMDPRRLKNKLTDGQEQDIKNESEVQDLYSCRERLHDEIRYKFGPIHQAKGQEVYDDYIAVNRAICSKLRMRQRAVIKQLQDVYDARAPSRVLLNNSTDHPNSSNTRLSL